MFDKNKTYKLKDLLNNYGMLNIEFKYYGNNNKGDLILYMKTGTDKVSVFTSLDNKGKYDYLKLNEEEALEVDFKFDKEVDEVDLDIAVLVLRTSDVNIPSARYSIETLDKLTKEQDQEFRNNLDGLEDGICYSIVDNNTAMTLYDGIYIFGTGGFVNDLINNKLPSEKNKLKKQNLQLILDYYKNNEKEASYGL